MADNAFNTLYFQEHIAAYERSKSLVTQTVTTEADVKGQTAYFLVAGSGGASATTRGANGKIPARADSLTQTSATLVQWHDLVEKHNFNIYAGQGNQRKIMHDTTMAVMNRKIDDLIIAAAMTGTRYAGLAAETATLATITKGLAILGVANVPLDGQISSIITPAFYSYLLQVKEFTNVQYINDKPFEALPVAFRWAGVNFIVHSGLSGVGTAAEYCLMYHKNAIGFCCDKESMSAVAGYDDKQDTSWCRATQYMGAALLQNTGVLQIRHDGSAFAATA